MGQWYERNGFAAGLGGMGRRLGRDGSVAWVDGVG